MIIKILALKQRNTKNMKKVLIQATGIKIVNDQDLTIVVYAEDIVLIAETEDEVKNTTNIWLKEEK